MNENYIVYICFYLFFLLFALIDASTVKLNIRERKFFLTVLVGVLGMFAGCRWFDVSVGGEIFDYAAYKYVYENPLNIGSFWEGFQNSDNYIRSMDPGYVLLSSLFSYLFSNANIYFLLISFLTVHLLVKGFQRNRIDQYIFLLIYIYVTRLYIQYNFIMMRQALAIVIVWWAMPFIFQHRKWKFWGYCLLASLFHFSALIAMIMPLFYKVRISRWIGLCVIIFSFCKIICYNPVCRRSQMKLISWNVNGIRACLNKGFSDFFKEVNADIFCLQETKCQPEQINLEFEGYTSYWNSAERKGYSGTAIFTKKQPVNVTYGIGIEEHDKEGRIITLEFENFYLVTNYTPNAKRELERLDYRMVWEDEIRKYLLELNKKKPVIMCGDLNVAHEEIDLKNPKTNKGNAGFTNEEREKMTELLNAGFIDSYRYLYPEKIEYSWWSYMGHAREKNVGWRIDYFIVSNDFRENIKDATIYTEILGSDHCPVGLEIK